MFQRLVIAAILFLSAAAFAMAAPPNPVDGKWQGTVSGPNGDQQSISDGKIEGAKLSFKTQFQDNTIEHEGNVSGDTIQLKAKGPWGDMDMTLKRVEEKKS